MGLHALLFKVGRLSLSPIHSLCEQLVEKAGLSGRQRVCWRVLQCRGKFGSPKLTPLQVSAILRANEYQANLQNGTCMRGFDTNQLASNSPIEDRRAEARCLQTTGMLFGVFDGHGGFSCAEVISRRLFRYVAASLLPLGVLQELSAALDSGRTDDLLLEWYNAPTGYVDNVGGTSPQLGSLYRDSFRAFVDDLIREYGSKAAGETAEGEFKMRDALSRAFLQLDRDLWKEVERAERSSIPGLLEETLTVALSGAVACLAHVDGLHLHVASAGDCSAVLGTKGESDTWVARPLTRPHAFENPDEEQRVRSEHPPGESETVIRHERLLGQLAPFRAFGDFAFKSTAADLERLSTGPHGGRQRRGPPPFYHTPPYLTARPEVSYHRLTLRDRFLVLATDGLWEQLSPSRVVQLVGEYMQGRQTLEPFRLQVGGRQRRPLTLGEVSRLLDKRQEGLEHKPVDANAATHLLRSALGGTEYGVDHTLLSQMLSAPPDVVRLIRDDISIVIVFFDKDYLRRIPP